MERRNFLKAGILGSLAFFANPISIEPAEIPSNNEPQKYKVKLEVTYITLDDLRNTPRGKRITQQSTWMEALATNKTRTRQRKPSKKEIMEMIDQHMEENDPKINHE